MFQSGRFWLALAAAALIQIAPVRSVSASDDSVPMALPDMPGALKGIKAFQVVVEPMAKELATAGRSKDAIEHFLELQLRDEHVILSPVSHSDSAGEVAEIYVNTSFDKGNIDDSCAVSATVCIKRTVRTIYPHPLQINGANVWTRSVTQYFPMDQNPAILDLIRPLVAEAIAAYQKANPEKD